MTKRPGVMSMDELMGMASAPEPIPAPEPAPVAPIVEPEVPEPPPAETAPQAPPKGSAKALPPVFRTSLYFHRAVHDALRDIAHEERLNVSDLINEGIEAVLKARDLPPIADLKAKGMPKRKRAGTR